MSSKRMTESRRTLSFINPIASSKKSSTPRLDTLNALTAGSQAHPFHQATVAICWDCDKFNMWQTCVTCMPCIFNLSYYHIWIYILSHTIPYYHISQHTTCISHHVNRCHCPVQGPGGNEFSLLHPEALEFSEAGGFRTTLLVSHRGHPDHIWSPSSMSSVSSFYNVLQFYMSGYSISDCTCTSTMSFMYLLILAKAVQPIQPMQE